MKEHQQVPGMIYIPLMVFLGISFYQTAIGFLDIVPPVFAWGFSGGITMIMAYLTHAIGIRRINSLPILGLIIFFAVCSLFSYAGNFNAVYTKYQKEQLYRDELTLHKQQITDVIATSDKALDNFSPENNEKELRVEQLTQQLVRQITDEARPGIGVHARKLITEIESLLGENLTEFAGGPNELAEKYSQNIRDIAKRKFTAGDLGRVESVKAENHKLAEQLTKLADDALVSTDLVKATGYATSIKLTDGINKIGLRTQEFIKNPARFKFEKVKFENQEIGKIAFSFKSGFTKHPFVSILLSVMCLFLDWAVVLYLIVRYGREDNLVANATNQMKLLNSDL